MNADATGLGPDLTKQDAADSGGSTSDRGWSPSPRTRSLTGRRELRRPIGDRMLAGVAAGIADYLDIDVTLVRIALAVLVFVGGAGLPLYLAGWLLIPEEGSDISLAGDLIGSFENRSR